MIKTIFISTFVSVIMFAAQPPSLIPAPQLIMYGNGILHLDSKTTLGVANGIDKDFAEMCADLLRSATGWEVPIVEDGTINLKLDSLRDKNSEAYQLMVTTSKIRITANQQKGLFYGFQTMRQLLPTAAFATQNDHEIAKWEVPVVRIIDAPAFSWRGILVDVSRHFQTKETIMKIIDGMAACKLNRFHWHLTDDQGWRVEIKKYPLLTKISKQYYSQDDIREVVKYAKLRNVTIVPEIDVPGHSSIATLAYPKLRCLDKNNKPSKSCRGYCPSNQYCYEFLNNVLSEIVELFPGEYIHIGADEVGRGSWKKCPRCQAFIKSQKLRNLHNLEGHFVQKVASIIRKKGKKVVTWDEAFNSHANKEQIIMSWRGIKNGLNAAKAGHKVVLCPVSALYYDRINSRSKHQNFGYSINTVTLDQSYFFTPCSPLLDDKYKKNILGAQGCIWGERIKSAKHVMMMAMMRGCALAEATWSNPSKRNWRSFLKRAEYHCKRLDAMQVAYFWEPMSNAIEIAKIAPGTITKNNGKIKVNLNNYINKNGMYEFIFHGYGGSGTFSVKQVTLFADDQKINFDKHNNTINADPRGPTQFYHIWVKKYQKGVNYHLLVDAKIEKADKFTGVVMLIPPLAKDQYSKKSGPTSKANGQKK